MCILHYPIQERKKCKCNGLDSEIFIKQVIFQSILFWINGDTNFELTETAALKEDVGNVCLIQTKQY